MIMETKADITDKELSEHLEHMRESCIPSFYSSRHDGTAKTLF